MAVYLDVSGSVNEHLPEIIGLLQRLKENLKTVYLFSTVVREIQFDSLLKGRVVTTYGTSFNCVAEHIVENELDLAVIVTDGFSILSEDCEEALRRLGCETLTVLFGDAPRGESWAKFGAVVKLADAVA